MLTQFLVDQKYSGSSDRVAKIIKRFYISILIYSRKVQSLMELTKEYADGHTMQRYVVMNIVREFSKELSKMQGRCIDVGSGLGDVTKDILLPNLSSTVEIVGADKSQNMTDFAKLKYANDKRLSFITMDIEASELPTNEIGQYDNVVSFFCLHWCRNIKRAFENIYKLLKPAGTVFVAFLGHHVGFETYIKLNKIPRYEPYMQDAYRYVPYFQYKKPQESLVHLRQILEEIGFKILECNSKEINYNYKDRETFRKHIVAVNPFVPRMPENMKENFIDDLMEEIMSRMLLYRGGDGEKKEEKGDVIPDKYNILFVYLKKEPQSIS